MHNTIVFVDDINFLRHNIDRVRELSVKDELTLIVLSDAAFFFLKAKGINCVNHRQFEYKNMYSNVYQTAKEWGTKWYKPNDVDVTIAGSYSLGNIIESMMINFFSHFLRLYISVAEILRNTMPKKIIILTSNDIDVAGDFFKRSNVDIGLLPNIFKKCIESNNLSCELETELLPYPDIDKGADYLLIKIARNTAYYFYQIFFSLTKIHKSWLKKRKKILFFEGFHHFQDIMASDKLDNFEKVHMQKSAGISLLPKLYRKNIRLVAVNQGCKGNKKYKLSLNKMIIKQEISDFFVYERDSLFDCVWPRINLLLNDYFSCVFVELNDFIGAIKTVLPACIVLENDSAYHERILANIAKKMSIPTIVIQHGISLCSDSYKEHTLEVHGFFPVLADRFFAFGDVTKEWLLNMKTPNNKITVTGCSRFDSYYKNDRIKGSNKNVLILLNDMWEMEGLITHLIGLHVFYRHISEFIEIAKKNHEINFIIRPHTPNSYWNELFARELSLLSNIKIYKKGSFEQVLSQVDLVIGYTSTALLEALVCRVPVISLDTGEYYSRLPLWEYGLSKRVSSFSELEAEIKKFIFDENQRKDFSNMIDKNLRLFNYDDDGRASQRIGEEIHRFLIY